MHDRHRHRPRRLDTGLVETHAVMGIAGGPVPQNLRIDGRAAASCRGFGLHKIDPGSLAKYKSITVFRKWTRSHLRPVVPRLRQDPHQTEAGKNSGSERRVHAAGDNDIGTPVDDGIAGVEQSVGRAGTAGRNHMTRAVETKRHRNFTAERSDSRCRNGINARFFRLASEPMLVLPLRKLQTTTAAADDNADAAPLYTPHHHLDQIRVPKSLVG